MKSNARKSIYLVKRRDHQDESQAVLYYAESMTDAELWASAATKEANKKYQKYLNLLTKMESPEVSDEDWAALKVKSQNIRSRYDKELYPQEFGNVTYYVVSVRPLPKVR